MKFGLTDAYYDLLDRLAISPLKQSGARVWIFGSRARGNHRRFSDIDILYSLENQAPLSAGLLSRIEEDLEESRLPIKVDLVNLSELAASYREGVMKERIEV